jgi:drug/metabolite transporter (DMT)-like permease
LWWIASKLKEFIGPWDALGKSRNNRTRNLTDHLDRSRRLRLKTIPLIFLSILMGPLGNVLLGKGMRGIAPERASRFLDFLPIIHRAFSSPWLWLGIACLLGFFLVHMVLLTWADYSYVQPATALSYASVALLSYLFLGEVVSPLRWTGVLLISLGVFIVGGTSPNTTETT